MKFSLVLIFLILPLVVLYAQSASPGGDLSASKKTQDESQLLRLTTSIVKESYCSDIGSSFLEWTLNLTYTNIGNRPILVDKKSSWIYRTMVSRNLRAASAGRYEYDPSSFHSDLSKIGFLNTAEADSFVVLKPGESFSVEANCRAQLHDGTKDSEDSLHPGNHVLQVRVATWRYYADPKVYRDKWSNRGYLWFGNVTSLPMPFTIEKQRTLVPCSR
jgi:hypothetical protein